MKNLAKTKVGKIVATNYKTATVLTAHDIDFCCGGGITLEEACRNKDIPVQQVIEELEESFKNQGGLDYENMPLDKLINEIVQVHHKYVESTAPALLTYLEKLCKVHGDRHPELFEIFDLFNAGTAALYAHMKKEEHVLFPYVQAMLDSQNKHFPLSRPHFVHIDNPISMMEDEHEQEGKRFHEIARLSNNYTCPSDGCQTYQVTYALLDEFERDLHKHIHLENNILFPKAQAMFSTFTFK